MSLDALIQRCCRPWAAGRTLCVLVVVLSLACVTVTPMAAALAVGASRQVAPVASAPLPEGSVFSSGDITYKVLSDSAVQVGDGVRPAVLVGGRISVPRTVTDPAGHEYVVTAIGDKAFEARPNSWGGYALPDTITRIGDRAFYRDNAASTLRTLPASVVSIGEEAFYGVQMTGDLVLPPRLTSVGTRAYAGTFLRSITIPASVRDVGVDGFRVDLSTLQEMVFEGKRLTLASVPFPASVKVQYTVRYLGAGGETVAEQRVLHGSMITDVPPVPDRPGLVGHWVPESGFSFSAPASDSFNAQAVYGQPPTDIDTCVVEQIPRQVFSGPPVAPSVTVTSPDGVSLKPGIDFIVSYAQNTSPGTGRVTVYGTGAYAGSRETTFDIYLDPSTPVDIAYADVPPVPAQVYTGEPKTPGVIVRFGPVQLVPGTDYTVTYADSTGPGTATAVVRGRGQYSGERRVTYEISASFKIDGITYKIIDATRCQVGDGLVGATTRAGVMAIPPTVTDPVTGRRYEVVAIGDRAFEGLTSITGFDLPSTLVTIGKRAFAACPGAADLQLPPGVVSLGNNAFAGSPVRQMVLPPALETIGNQAFKETMLSEIVIPASVTSIGADAFASVPALTRVVYEGKRVAYPFAPSVGVYFTVRFLEVDGGVRESVHVRMGTLVSPIPDPGWYAGLAGFWVAERGYSLHLPVTDSFFVRSIHPPLPLIDIATCVVAPVPVQTYTGTPVEPTLSVRTHSGRVLKPRVDYRIVYEANDAPGMATAFILGQGLYHGVARAHFAVQVSPDTAVDLSQAVINPIAEQPFTGQPLTPSVTVKLGGMTLRPDVDYVVSYADNVWIGTATVTVTGRGQYTGTASAGFAVTAAAETPDGRINLRVLDAAIALAEAVDPAVYTRSSVARMTGQLVTARALRTYILAAGLTTLDQNQNRIDEAARLLLLSYQALEERWGAEVTIVVSAATSAVRTQPFSTAPTVMPLVRGTALTARVDRDVEDSWWYQVVGSGYVPATDVFEMPVTGVGAEYRVVCLKAPTPLFRYPFEWAERTGARVQGEVLTVRTANRDWLVVADKGSDGRLTYAYVRAGDVRLADGETVPGVSTPPTGEDPNAADPAESNPETRPAEIPGHGEGGLGPNPGGLVPVDWWPGSGTTGIDRLERFWVKFPHNISDPGDAEVNVNLLRLYKADGTLVPSRVFTRDRNLYPDSRRYIYLEPIEPLDWGTRYYLEILPGFRSRNGMVSTVTLRIPFSTEIYPFGRGEGTGPGQFTGPGAGGVAFGTEFGPGDGGEPSGSTGDVPGGGPALGGGTSGSGSGTGSGTGARQGRNPRGGLTGDREVSLVMNPSSQVDVPAVGSAASVIPLLGLGIGGGGQAPGGMAPVWPGVLLGAFAALLILAITRTRRAARLGSRRDEQAA